MFQILFFGSSPTKVALQKSLHEFAQIVDSGNVHMCICEIINENDLQNIPVGDVQVPVFLLINTREKNILEKLRHHQINGIFYFPVNPDAIKRKIIQVFNLKVAAPSANNTAQDYEKIKVKILAKVENIPMLPRFVNSIILLAQKGTTTISEITTLIKKDQGISGRVIRLANSPFFLLSQSVASIDKAVVLLGFDTVKNIALAASTDAYYNKPFQMYNTTGNALWSHAYRVAMLSETIAKSVTGVDSNMMFLAGLFHDIGKTILVDFLMQKVDSIEDERKQLDIDHAELAGMIVKRWQLPELLINTISQHHAPGELLHAQILYYSDSLAHAAQGKNSGEVLLAEIDEIIVKSSSVITYTDLEYAKQKIVSLLATSGIDE